MLTYDSARAGSVARARELRRNSTDAERKLWRALRVGLPQHKWRRQMPIGPYFADFACFAAGLVIELDGGKHAEAVERDAARTLYIEVQGYRVVRFWNDDVLRNLDGVIGQIADRLSASPSRSRAAGPALSHGRGEIAEATS